MGTFNQQELARMHAQAESFNERIEADRLRGGNPATIWNKVYDEAGLIFMVWRKTRGRFGCMIVKGMFETGRAAAPVQQAVHAVPSPEDAVAIARILHENPKARWVYGTRHDGVRFLGIE